MPRFENAVTGVTVSVDDDTAANLDPHMWTAVKDASDDKPTRRSSK
jgi:hypothetical protein